MTEASIIGMAWIVQYKDTSGLVMFRYTIFRLYDGSTAMHVNPVLKTVCSGPYWRYVVFSNTSSHSGIWTARCVVIAQTLLTTHVLSKKRCERWSYD